MSTLRGFKFFLIFLVISISVVFLSMPPCNGYCADKWVQAVSNDNNIIYYDPSGIKLDEQQKIIDVSTKWIFTDKGKKKYLKNIKQDNDQKSNDIHHSVILYSLNYKDWKFNITKITEYSKSGKILYSDNSSHEWRDISPNSIIDPLLNKILQKYNIRR